MNILCTGGAGFIGSHLVERLLQKDNDVTIVDGESNRVIVVDDFSEGKWANLPKSPRLKVYETSIMADIGHLFKDIDIVYHMAALTRPQWSIIHPYKTNEVNVSGTIKVLEHSRDHRVKRVVLMSSSAMYGENIYPTKEEYKPNPMSPYALTKYIDEQYCKLFEKLYGLESNYTRPFNVYGSRMPFTGIYTSAVAMFIDMVKKKLPIKITGDGEQRRDFIYIDDVVDQLLLMSTSKVYGEAFNCGSGTNKSINELLETIARLMGEDVTPSYIPPVIEPTQTLADITKAKELLGWKPKIGFEEGLKRTIKGILK
jgi:nucleoside-diphosphate-sugar epimerase